MRVALLLLLGALIVETTGRAVHKVNTDTTTMGSLPQGQEEGHSRSEKANQRAPHQNNISSRGQSDIGKGESQTRTTTADSPGISTSSPASTMLTRVQTLKDSKFIREIPGTDVTGPADPDKQVLIKEIIYQIQLYRRAQNNHSGNHGNNHDSDAALHNGRDQHHRQHGRSDLKDNGSHDADGSAEDEEDDDDGGDDDDHIRHPHRPYNHHSGEHVDSVEEVEDVDYDDVNINGNNGRGNQNSNENARFGGSSVISSSENDNTDDGGSNANTEPTVDPAIVRDTLTSDDALLLAMQHMSRESLEQMLDELVRLRRGNSSSTVATVTDSAPGNGVGDEVRQLSMADVCCIVG